MKTGKKMKRYITKHTHFKRQKNIQEHLRRKIIIMDLNTLAQNIAEFLF